jgi:NAD(P)-dependent dehydrogenase (short-subunit alcohol dehydrogenase family)
MKVTAIIPIKHESTRVHGKNYRLMNNKPLYFYIINTLLNTKSISEIIIDTNSPTIKDGIPEHFPNANIRIYDRPDHLCSNDTSTNALLMNVIQDLDLVSDLFFQTHTTNPLLKSETIDDAIRMFISNNNNYDSLFSVKTHHTRLYDKNGNDMNHNRHPTQDLDPIYEENSCMYLFTRESLFKFSSRIGVNAMMYKMSDIESQDIDWEEDFKITEILMEYFDNKKQNKKIVIVTGALGGIGSKTCVEFKKLGWHVIGTDIKTDNPETIRHIMDRFILCDLTNSSSLDKLINVITTNYGLHGIDCLVNNAAHQIVGPLESIKMDQWDKVMDCNLKAPLILSTKLLNLLEKRSGNIINISSIHSKCTSPKIAAYACSKSALAGLTRNMAIDFSKKNVRVNSISPGAIDTPMLSDHLTNEQLSLMKKNKHMGKPEDIFKAIKFITECDFINGENMVVDGGVSIRLSSE